MGLLPLRELWEILTKLTLLVRNPGMLKKSILKPIDKSGSVGKKLHIMMFSIIQSRRKSLSFSPTMPFWYIYHFPGDWPELLAQTFINCHLFDVLSLGSPSWARGTRGNRRASAWLALCDPGGIVKALFADHI